MKNIPMIVLTGIVACASSPAVHASNVAQTLPFTQAWTDTSLISTNNDWSHVPGFAGYAGNGLTATTGTDPQTILADGTTSTINILANQSDPTLTAAGGLAEFQGTVVPDASVAFQGSAPAPFLLLNLDTSTNFQIRVQYDLRDIEAGVDNSVQQVALHYRVGNTGAWTNVPAAYVADATTGPGIATKVTHIDVILPTACENKPLVQLRVMTTNAPGNDEWVGIDNIAVSGSSATATQATTWGILKALYR